MSRYKVITYSATVAEKVYLAHSIIEQKDIPEDRLRELLKEGFLEPYDEEEELKKEIEKEEKNKKKGA